MSKVEIVEVGPRDGLQNIPDFVPTNTKVALIRALLAAGFTRIRKLPTRRPLLAGMVVATRCREHV